MGRHSAVASSYDATGGILHGSAGLVVSPRHPIRPQSIEANISKLTSFSFTSFQTIWA